MRNITLNAEEVAVLMMMYWPAPFPGGKGIGGLLPYGVKNVLKWKNRIGLDRAAKRFETKMKKERLWNSPELGSIAMPVLYYNKGIVVQKDTMLYKSIYFGEDLFVMIDQLGEDEYVFSMGETIDELACEDFIGKKAKVILLDHNEKGKEITIDKGVVEIEKRFVEDCLLNA